jgi:Uma2 family endonuclease
MITRVLMDVDEYLRTSFEDGDCDYLDGEVVERNVGELPHSRVQGQLLILLSQIGGLIVLPEIRIQIGIRRFRVADLAVWREGNIGERIPAVPPFLAVEILSSEDRMVRMQPKIQEYLSTGTEWVWLIDPEERKALCYSQAHPGGEPADILFTENPRIEIPVADLFDRPAQ